AYATHLPVCLRQTCNPCPSDLCRCYVPFGYHLWIHCLSDSLTAMLCLVESFASQLDVALACQCPNYSYAACLIPPASANWPMMYRASVRLIPSHTNSPHPLLISGVIESSFCLACQILATESRSATLARISKALASIEGTK